MAWPVCCVGTVVRNRTGESVMSTAKACLWAAMGGLLLAAAMVPAQAQTGLRLRDDSLTQQATWPHWQARFGLAATTTLDAGARWQFSAGQLLGDYYWRGLRPRDTHTDSSGGFRATGGVLLGQRSLALGTPALASAQGGGLTLSRSVRLAAPGRGDGAAESWSAVPYVGIGYSGVSLRGGWGFTADVGLTATSGGLRARRDGALGTQGLDELLRELRLTPVLQFGASYAF